MRKKLINILLLPKESYPTTRIRLTELFEKIMEPKEKNNHTMDICIHSEQGVLESLACGAPVVSTDVGDVHKLVKNGKTGYIIKTRNQKEIKTKIINALAENDKFKENCIKNSTRVFLG